MKYDIEERTIKFSEEVLIPLLINSSTAQVLWFDSLRSQRRHLCRKVY